MNCAEPTRVMANRINRQTSLVCLVLVLITLAVYWPVRHYDFVQYDDPDYVLENQTVQNGITWYGLEWAFVDVHVYNYHPVTWLSHMLDCQFFGVNAGAQHLVNVSFHAINSMLLFLALRMITGAFWRSSFVAAFFAWHPLRVESVAWISERKDVLSGFFFIAMLFAYAKYANAKIEKPKAEPPQPSSIKTPILPFSPGLYYWVSVGCFALGLLSKPMLVTVPFVLLLLDFWPLRRLDFTTSGSSFIPWSRLGPLICEKTPFILLSLGVGLITFAAQHSGGAVVSLSSEGFSSRVATMLIGYLGYLEKTFWPNPLTFLYLRPASFPVTTILIAALVILGISAICLRSFCRGLPVESPGSAIVFGWFWFLVMLLPVCGLLQAGPQLMADRYTYLPSIGLGIIIAWGANELALKFPAIGASRVVLFAVGIAALGLCVNCARHQLGFWQNTETLMMHALTIDPNNYVAHQNLSVYYSKIGNIQAASDHRQRFRQLNPTF